MAKILVTESLGEAGLDVLSASGDVDVRLGLSAEELIEAIAGYHALVVRSRTDVTSELLAAGSQLRVVGRAGTGVDNIDVEAATLHGIYVVNAPTGNSNAVAEHTIALLLALARNVYPAVGSLKAGRWEKSKLQGIEVKDKCLGLVGLGRIGSMVASKARGLEMKVGAFDPYASPERAASSGVELMTLAELLQWADFVSVHTPLLPQTRGMIGAEQLALMKPTAYILNCARGGIVNEEALLAALEGGQIAGAALDVFVTEPATSNPLIAQPNVIATPHVGASTAEAQENVAVDVARSIADVLEGRMPATPVNMPYLPPQAADYLKPFVDLAQRMGSFFMQWRDRLEHHVEIAFEGALCEYDTTILASAFVAGLLQPVTGEPVNLVNAMRIADQRGLVISEVRRGPRKTGDRIIARFPDKEAQNISGAIVQGEPRLIGLDDLRLDCVIQGHMLVDLHNDRPGIVGKLGQLLGDANQNISFVQMSRVSRGGDQIMILGLDEPAADTLMDAVIAIPNICRAKLLALPGFDDL